VWVTEIVFSIVIAAVFVGLLILILKPSKEENTGIMTFAFLFVALFLPIWAGGIWLGPMGPAILGMYVLPFLLIGLCVALLLAAVSPPRKDATAGQTSYEPGPAYTFGPFFFAFILIFLFVIFMRYLYS
jgi:hypothetical protein